MADTTSVPPPPAQPPAVPKRGFLFKISAAVDSTMRTLFFNLGYLVAGNPVKTILASLALTGLLLIGMLRFRTESRPEELWVPQGTVALANQDYVEANYGQLGRTSTIAFVARDGRGLANRDAFLEMLNVAEDAFKVTAAPIDDAGADNTPINFPERCKTTSDFSGNNVCDSFSAFGLFYNPDDAEEGPNGLVDFFAVVRSNITNSNDAQIKATLQNPPALAFNGRPFNADEIIGGTTGDGSNFDVKILLYTQLTENNVIVEDGEEIDKEADALEEAWTVRLLETSPFLATRTLDWYVESLWSRNDSLEQALTGDLPLLSVGFVLLGIYVVLFLGDFHTIRSHMLLGLGAISTTGLALGACFGISSATGMFFGPVHQILPLLIIGIGIDDCFHVTRAADDINRRPDIADKPVRLRIALALSTSGAAITVTSFTNVVVFLLSAISRLPALRFFALWAAFGIFFAWLFAITYYTALLTLDLRRQQAKRRDCFPCFKPVEHVKELNWFKRPAGGFSRFFGNQFGPFIMRPIVRAVLLVLFTAGLAACCYGVSQLYLKFDFSFFYPDGSAQKDFQDQVDEYFQLGDPTRIYIRDRDLSTPENQRRLLRLCKPQTGTIAQNEWIQTDSVDCWYHALREEINLVDDNQFIPQASFVDEVKAFIAPGTKGARYANDTLFNDDNTEMVGCRFAAQYIYRETNDDEITALESVREDCDNAGFGDDAEGNPAAFPYIFFDTFTEQYDALPGEIGLSLGLASVAVATVCLVLVGHPLVAAISVLVVGIIIIDVLGLTYFSDINLNSVSVITLVLCTGIAVDFVVHIMRSFLEHVGTRKDRAIKSLETMGPPVFYAGFSTFLAIIVLAIAKSYIFRVIFRGFLFLVLMGFVHGLILGPILLSLIGPASFYVDEEDKQKAEKALEDRVAPTKDSDEEGGAETPGIDSDSV